MRDSSDEAWDLIVSDGALTLAIGDVTGHDREAAARAQVRNLLRGTAYTLGEPPSAITLALDKAIRGLGVDSSATALLAKVDPAPGSPSGHYRLRWTVAPATCRPPWSRRPVRSATWTPRRT